jgi:hypothetical protein
MQAKDAAAAFYEEGIPCNRSGGHFGFICCLNISFILSIPPIISIINRDDVKRNFKGNEIPDGMCY